MLLETIVTSLDDARAATAGRADRFELCSALAVGGLTPSLGTIMAINAVMSVPVMCMIRPRQGGCCYTDAEFDVMLRDTDYALDAGAGGVVFGFLTADGEVDVARCRRYLGALPSNRNVETVFHRAYDVVPDPERALEQLIDLGISRVLTSGRAARAMEGLDEIRRTVERARNRIDVLPGGGIRLPNVREVVEQTGVNQIHLYPTYTAADPSARANPAISFGVSVPATEVEYPAVDGALVRQIREALDSMPKAAS